MIFVTIFLLVCLCVTLISVPRYHNKKAKTVDTHTEVRAYNFRIDFNENETFRSANTPAGRDGNSYHSYSKHLNAAINFLNIKEREGHVLYTLRAQERQMVQLKNKLTEAVRRTNITDVYGLQEIVNPVYAAYNKNREDAVEVLRNCYTDALNREDADYSAIINDIAHDNESFIKALTDLLDCVVDYNARINRDDTPEHISDFVGLNDLVRFTNQFRNILDAAKEQPAETPVPAPEKTVGSVVPTINFATLVATQQEVQEQSQSDAPIIDPMNSYSPQADGF